MKVVNITEVMIKLQFKLPQALISRGFARRTSYIEDDSKEDISLERFNGSPICFYAINVSSSDNEVETESTNKVTEDVKDPNILKIFIANNLCMETIVTSRDDESNCIFL